MFTITEYYNSVILSATELRTNNDRHQPGEDTDVYLFAELKRIDGSIGQWRDIVPLRRQLFSYDE